MPPSDLVPPTSLIDYGAGVLRPALERGSLVLDAHLRVPPRARLPLRAIRRANGQIGTYLHERSLVVNCHYSETTRVEALLHEYAHFLDRALLPGAGYASFQETGPLARVVALALESAPAEEIRRRAAYWKPGRPGWRRHQTRWLDLVSPPELFARALTQWLALAGPDDELRARYPDERPGLDHESRWSQEEFAPLAKALEHCFSGLGWLASGDVPVRR